MAFTPGDKNTPNHPFYQKRYNVHLAREDKTREYFSAFAPFDPDMPPPSGDVFISGIWVPQESAVSTHRGYSAGAGDTYGSLTPDVWGVFFVHSLYIDSSDLVVLRMGAAGDEQPNGHVDVKITLRDTLGAVRDVILSWVPANLRYEAVVASGYSNIASHLGNVLVYEVRTALGPVVSDTTGNPETGTYTDADGHWRWYRWLNNGSFTLATGGETNALRVAGGGSGGGTVGSQPGGGGGGGGMVEDTVVLEPKTYDVTVGAGGVISGLAGGNSDITLLGVSVHVGGPAIGGGRGGDGASGAGNPGGSGGGAGAGSALGGAGTTGQGFAGSNNSAGFQAAAGGGGASETGYPGIAGVTGGNGGNGAVSSITGAAIHYAGGGGGGQYNEGQPAGAGGLGGGGAGGVWTALDSPATPGTSGLGGGGGGTGRTTVTGATNGGSGVVIIRFKV